MDATLAQTLLAITVILATARLFGALFRRCRQPRICGEMLAGLLVGAALLSPWRRIGAARHVAVLDKTVVHVIQLLGQVGVILYMLLVGLTIAPVDLRRHARPILTVAAPVILAAAALTPIGVSVFAGGHWQLADGAAGSLVIAAALLVNGFPVVARILEERDLLGGGFGSIVLGASALITALPFVLVAVAEAHVRVGAVAAIAHALELSLALTLGLILAIRWPSFSSRLRPRHAQPSTRCSVAVVSALLAAWLSLKLVGTGMLGPFLVGIALSRSTSTRVELERTLGEGVRVLLVPVVLAAAGARIDPRVLDLGVLEGAVLFTVLLVAVAVIGGSAMARVPEIGRVDARAIARRATGVYGDISRVRAAPSLGDVQGRCLTFQTDRSPSSSRWTPESLEVKASGQNVLPRCYSGRVSTTDAPVGKASAGEARERLVNAAYELFSRQGVQAVGVDAIIARSGVARQTMYRHFASKQDLVLAFLERREQVWTRQWLEAEVVKRATDPRERLLAVFDVFDGWFRGPDFEGCSFINVMLEHPDAAHPVHRAAAAYLAGIRHFLEGLARQAGIPDSEGFARQWHILMKGSIVAAGEGDQDAAQRAKEVAAGLLDQALTGTAAAPASAATQRRRAAKPQAAVTPARS